MKRAASGGAAIGEREIVDRLRMEHRAGLSSARTELAAVERDIRKLVQAIKDGVSALSIKDKLLSLEAGKPTCNRA